MSFFLRFNWYIYTYFQKFDRNPSSSRTSYNIFFNILSLMGCKSVFSSSVFLSFMRSSLNGTRFRFGIQSSRAFFHLCFPGNWSGLKMFSRYAARKISQIGLFRKLHVFALYSLRTLLQIISLLCLYRVTVAFSLLLLNSIGICVQFRFILIHFK